MAQTLHSVGWACVILVTTSAALVTLIVLHVVPSDLSPVRNAVSHYGISRYRLGYRIMTISMGLAGLATAAAVATDFPAPGRPLAIVLLIAFGVLRLVISWFPMDEPGAPRTRHGSAHGLLVIATFLSAPAAANRMQRLLQRASTKHEIVGVGGYGAALQIAFWLMVAALIVMFVFRRLPGSRSYFGAVERVVYTGIFVLLMSTGVVLA